MKVRHRRMTSSHIAIAQRPASNGEPNVTVTPASAESQEAANEPEAATIRQAARAPDEPSRGILVGATVVALAVLHGAVAFFLQR